MDLNKITLTKFEQKNEILVNPNIQEEMGYNQFSDGSYLVSERAFENLKYIESVSAESKIYYPKFFSRDNNARLTYRRFTRKTK